jgi:hypothetical protein
VLAVTFFATLVFVAGQKALYVDLLRAGLAGEGEFRESLA